MQTKRRKRHLLPVDLGETVAHQLHQCADLLFKGGNGSGRVTLGMVVREAIRQLHAKLTASKVRGRDKGPKVPVAGRKVRRPKVALPESPDPVLCPPSGPNS